MQSEDLKSVKCSYCNSISYNDIKGMSIPELKEFSKKIGVEETKKEDMIEAIYQKTKPYIYHRKKGRDVDWAVCFNCVKKFFDKILGDGKDGGRIKE